MSNWDKRFIGLARHKASWSKDPSTKVGCVLVNPETMSEVAQGFNGFPRGVREVHELDTKRIGTLGSLPAVGSLDPDRWARPAKYFYVEHAERNAIYNAARQGHATEGCWAYLNFSPEDICADCARAFIQAGITRIVGPEDRMEVKHDADWYAGRAVAQEMLDEADVGRVVLSRQLCE